MFQLKSPTLKLFHEINPISAAELKNELLRRGGPMIVNYRYQLNEEYFTCI